MVVARSLPDRGRILDEMDVVVIVLTAGGVVLSANAAACVALGLPVHRIVGHDVAALPCWEQRCGGDVALRAGVAAAFAGNPVELELGVHASEVEVLELRLRLLSDPDQPVVVLTGVDMTGEHRARAELHQREASARRVLEAVPAGVVEVAPDGRIVFANDEARGLLGMRPDSPAEIRLSNFESRTVWEDGSPCLPADYPVTRCLETGEAQRGVTIGIERPGGGRTWALGTALPLRDTNSGELTGAVVTFVDITARVEAERALEQSERRLAEAQRIGRLGHWEWDVTEDTLSWSDEAYRILGLEPGAFQPTYAAFLERVHPEDREFVASAVDRTLRSNAPYGIDHRIVRPGGEVAFVNETGSVTRDETGAPVRMLGTVQDITDRKVGEEELRRSLEEKNVLLREVHHRVKNNLQVVSSLLFLQSSSAPDPKLEAMLDESRRRIRAMALIHESLHVSSDMRAIPMREYVIRLVTALLGSFSELRGRVDVETQVAEVSLDIERAIPCGLIINELVTNSLKYAFRGCEHGTVRVAVRRDGERCAVEVTDDGVGLPDDVELDSPATLGLRLVRTLADQIDADLAILRAPGTSFVLRFTCSPG